MDRITDIGATSLLGMTVGYATVIHLYRLRIIGLTDVHAIFESALANLENRRPEGARADELEAARNMLDEFLRSLPPRPE